RAKDMEVAQGAVASQPRLERDKEEQSRAQEQNNVRGRFDALKPAEQLRSANLKFEGKWDNRQAENAERDREIDRHAQWNVGRGDRMQALLHFLGEIHQVTADREQPRPREAFGNTPFKAAQSLQDRFDIERSIGHRGALPKTQGNLNLLITLPYDRTPLE